MQKKSGSAATFSLEDYSYLHCQGGQNLSLCQEASFLPKWLSFSVGKKNPSYSLSFYILLPSCFDGQHDSSPVFFFSFKGWFSTFYFCFSLIFLLDNFWIWMPNKVNRESVRWGLVFPDSALYDTTLIDGTRPFLENPWILGRRPTESNQ